MSDAQNLASVVKFTKPSAVAVESLYPPGNALNPFKSFPGVSQRNSLLYGDDKTPAIPTIWLYSLAVGILWPIGAKPLASRTAHLLYNKPYVTPLPL